MTFCLHNFYCHFCAKLCILELTNFSFQMISYHLKPCVLCCVVLMISYLMYHRVCCAAFQGVLTVKSEVCQSSELLAALFHHECSRVIADRFIDSSDRQTFSHIVQKVCALVSAAFDTADNLCIVPLNILLS